MGNSHMDFVCEFTLMCDGNDETLHAAYPLAAYPLFWLVQTAKLKKKNSLTDQPTDPNIISERVDGWLR